MLLVLSAGVVYDLYISIDQVSIHDQMSTMLKYLEKHKGSLFKGHAEEVSLLPTLATRGGQMENVSSVTNMA